MKEDVFYLQIFKYIIMEDKFKNRTAGVWAAGYGDSSNSFGIFTKEMLDDSTMESPICLISPFDAVSVEDKANAAFIVTACNNYELVVKALENIIECQYSPVKTLANLNGAVHDAKNLLHSINANTNNEEA